jgi:O-antigen ligase
VIVIILLVAAGVDIRYISKDSDTGPELNIGLTGRDVWYIEVFLHSLDQQPFGSGWGGSDQYVFEIRDGKVFNTHSQHLQLFHDVGIIGYVLFLIGFVAVLIKLGRFYKKAIEYSTQKFFAMVAFGSLLGLFISMTTDSTWPASQFYGDYIFLCLGLSLYYCSEQISRVPLHP